MRNIVSFGAKFFELPMKRISSKFIFRIANLKFNHCSFVGGLLEMCQNLNVEEIGKHVHFSFSFFKFLSFLSCFVYVYHFIR